MQHVVFLLLVSALLLGAQRCCGATGSGTLNASLQHERDVLLSFKAGITNWEEVQAARQWAGWMPCLPDSCMPVCQWGGVECSPYHEHGADHATELHLSCDSECTVPLRGRLVGQLQQLGHLEVLSLAGNQLSGPLPEAWGAAGSFPELVEMDLSNNLLTGNMPDSWSTGPAFNRLISLRMAGNKFRGPFPPLFGPTNTSFVLLEILDMGDNQMTGPLPAYFNGINTMLEVALHNNRLTGALPASWGTEVFLVNSTVNATDALQRLFLHGNNLTGGLPDAWGRPGSFAALRQLTLSDNPRLLSSSGSSGGLPDGWGAVADTLPKLQLLNLTNTGLAGLLPGWGPGLQSLQELGIAANDVTGSIPASWAQLASLDRITLQPGNPGLCTELPPGADFKLCSEGDLLCLESISTSNTCQSSDDGGSFPVAAVAVPVAVVGTAVLLALCWWAWRRRREMRLRQEGMEAGQASEGSKGGAPPAVESKADLSEA